MRIPRGLKEEIKREAEKRNATMWQVLVESLSAYREVRRGRVQRNDIDRISWYVFKLSASIGELRASPTQENKQKTLETLSEIGERLGVSVEELELAVKAYDGSREKRRVLNDTAKLLVTRILEKWVGQDG
jgi:hypothetical protein